MRLLYNLSVYALLLVLFIYFLWRSLREPEYRRRWGERLGYTTSLSGKVIWIHAASVGEVQSASPVVSALLQEYPDANLLVTTFTPTGSALVQHRIMNVWGDRVRHCYLPLDTPGAVNRFLKRTHPDCLLIVETELWPNLLVACRSRMLSVAIISATLSEKSLQRYLAFPGSKILPDAVGAILQVHAQSETDAARFRELGVAPQRIRTVGNLKFDYTPSEDIIKAGRSLRQNWGALERPVWVAGSTHEGEEQMVLESYCQLRKQINDLLLVLVPRHPQRFERSFKLCMQPGLLVARHSRKEKVDDETEVILGDTLGDLLSFYALADVVFVGGSLVPVGGHNLLEPAAMGCAVVAGPHTGSQQQLRELLVAAGGYIEVQDARSLTQTVQMLFDSPSRRAALGHAAKGVISDNQGVVKQTVELLKPLIGQ